MYLLFLFSVSFPGEVTIIVNLQLVMDADFSNDLLNRTSSKFVTMEENIKTSVSSIPNKGWLVRTFACKRQCCALYIPRLLR